jgi:general secretion pathway protein K
MTSRHATHARQRGAALLVAVTAIAILTVISVDLAFSTRVSVQAAANARDELRALALAKSGVALSRLVLNLQQQLDAAAGTMGAAAGALGGAAGGLAGAAQLSLRLWDLVPVDSSMTQVFLGGAGGAGAAPPPLFQPAAQGQGPAGAGEAAGATSGTARQFGDAQGSFHAEIDDEDRKINIRQFDGLPPLPYVQSLRLAQLVRDPRYDFLFDEDDANGIRVTRPELFAALKDWQDLDETSSTFTGDTRSPFQNGFGDENGIYDRLDDRYKAKNAAFDSLDELYLVAGVSDAFMAAFGDKLTVYPDVNATVNVNTNDPQQLLLNALIMSDPPGVPQPALADPQFLGKLQNALALVRPLPFMSMKPQQFAAALQALGVKVRSEFTQAVTDPGKSGFGDRSTTFSIRSVGSAGDVKKTIDAVVTFDRRAEGLARDQGRLLHWHEE